MSPNSTSAPTLTPPDLQPFKNIGTRHYAVVQVVLANAANPEAARLWRRFEDKIKIGSLDTKDTAFHRNGALYFDLDSVSKGDAVNRPYQILFHEGAHCIDYLNRVGQQFFSEAYRNEALLKALRADFDRLIEAERIRLNCNSNEQALASLKKTWTRAHRALDRASFSDLLDAYTHGKYSLGISHGAAYWDGFGSPAKSREAFADFMDAAVANAQSYELLRRYLPSATQTFERMLDELLR